MEGRPPRNPVPVMTCKEARRPMPDPRWDALAETLIQHSTRLAAGETLLIECFDLEDRKSVV